MRPGRGIDGADQTRRGGIMTPLALTPPAIEPVSLSEAKDFLRIIANDEDELLGTLITAARLMIEAAAGRLLIEQSWRIVLDAWPQGEIGLPLSPVRSLKRRASIPPPEPPNRFCRLAEPGRRLRPPDRGRRPGSGGGPWACGDRSRSRRRLRRDPGHGASPAAAGRAQAGLPLAASRRRGQPRCHRTAGRDRRARRSLFAA